MRKRRVEENTFAEETIQKRQQATGDLIQQLEWQVHFQEPHIRLYQMQTATLVTQVLVLGLVTLYPVAAYNCWLSL